MKEEWVRSTVRDIPLYYNPKEKAVRMDTSINVLGTNPCVREVLAKSMDLDLNQYPTPYSDGLRQALAQERAALDALGDDPRAVAAGRLDAVAAALPSLPREPAAEPAPASWWERMMGGLVEVRPSSQALALDPADRAAGLAALQLELTLAQGAIARGDREGLRAALDRVEGWMLRLWPASPARERQREALRALRGQPLSPQLPTLGSTLEQLRRQRGPG